MNIKDPSIHAAAQELARLRGISMTEAVRQAVAAALDAERTVRSGTAQRLLEVGARSRARLDRLGLAPLTDDELYDRRGLPR